MANLTFTDLQNEVYTHTGLDSSDSTNQTNVKRWLNYVVQDICARWPWPFMEGRESITTVPDYSTGTVSISSGSTTVTGSGTTFSTTQANLGQSFIQFSSANDWYRVSSGSSATSLTLDKAYAPTTNLTAGTYIFRQFFYSLSSTADRIVDIRNWNTPVKLVQVDARTVDDLRPNPQSTNSPYGYVAWGIDTSGYLQITPYPFPSDGRLFEIRTIKRPTDMSAPTDTPSIPNKYAHVICWGANSIGFAFLRKFDAAAEWSGRFEKRIMEMRSEYRMTEDLQPILRSIDSVQRSKWIGMPEQYPVVTG